MEAKNMKFVKIETVVYLTGPSYDVVSKFEAFIKTKMIDIDAIKLITIQYDTELGDLEKAPVKIYFSTGLIMYLNLKAGYNGNSPSDLCKVLKLCEIDFEESDILSKQKVVDLRYVKDSKNCYQFYNIDETHEYSM